MITVKEVEEIHTTLIDSFGAFMVQETSQH